MFCLLFIITRMDATYKSDIDFIFHGNTIGRKTIIAPSPKGVLKKYLRKEWITTTCSACGRWDSRGVFPLPSRSPGHLPGRDFGGHCQLPFCQDGQGTDTPGSLDPWRLLSSLPPDRVAALWFRIYLPLSHQLQEKGKMTIPCKTRTPQFQIVIVC